MTIKRKHTKLVWLSILLCALSLAVMVYALADLAQPKNRFVPPKFDKTAVQGVPPLTNEDGYSELNATVYSFGLCGFLQLDGDHTDVWLYNDAENENVWLKVVLKDLQDNKLGESGLIRPGEYVQSVRLANPPAKTTDVKMVVMGYEPETYYSVGNVTLITALETP